MTDYFLLQRERLFTNNHCKSSCRQFAGPHLLKDFSTAVQQYRWGVIAGTSDDCDGREDAVDTKNM